MHAPVFHWRIHADIATSRVVAGWDFVKVRLKAVRKIPRAPFFHHTEAQRERDETPKS